jgi:hypothetical protein
MRSGFFLVLHKADQITLEVGSPQHSGTTVGRHLLLRQHARSERSLSGAQRTNVGSEAEFLRSV